MGEKKPYIVSAEKISEKAYALEIYHPLIARNFKPGQFATVQASPESARIPLQIVDTDPEKETFWVVVRAYNRPTLELIEILKPIINSDSIWKSHSLLLLGDYFLSKDEKQNKS